MKRAVFVLLAAAACGSAQPEAIAPIPKFPIRADALTITRRAKPGQPFSVAGPNAALLGEQSGTFEAWLFPVKVLSHFHIMAELANYPVPIDVTAQAAAIEVTPAMTTITYSHAAFTVKQRMFIPRANERGMEVLFEIAAVHPMVLTFEFKPDLLRMWPAPSFGTPNAEWIKQRSSGYYMLRTDDPSLTAAVAMPRAQPGILAPYQERPSSHPVQLKLAFDPKRDSNFYFPLLISMEPPGADPARDLAALAARVASLYSDTADYYQHFFDSRLTPETPNRQFDDALRWAEIAIDQGRVRLGDETGLVAGDYESGDSARPGFAWFFGRDALWTSYAINGYGDFELTRRALEFLIRRQRADGKIMHEYSQTAALVDWKALPYFYAAADSTPLFVMGMEDYVNTSGDLAFLKSHWDAVRRAWAFTREHDSDGDGIYENTEGTGWVESWLPRTPHQEIYLAALDQQSADAMSRMAAIVHEDALADSARRKAAEIRGKLESEYFEPAERFYAFSRNANGTLDRTATIYPAVAWWTGRLALAQPDAMLERWASPEFSTDWGTRDVSDGAPFYDPISYHQGSVWPLFTGWVSVAEYRAGHALAGYQHLMQNADLTWAQDLGAVTELLSGEFFQPLGRSTAHQVWSSAMVLTPALRGLFGLDWDALGHTLRLAPHLPATWDQARLRNVPLGELRLDVEYRRQGGRLVMRARADRAAAFCLAERAAPEPVCGDEKVAERQIDLPLPPVEIEPPHGLPLPGSQTAQLKIVSERMQPNRLDLELEASAGSAYDLPVRLNAANVRVSGAELAGGVLRLRFAGNAGYQRVSVRFTW